MLDKDFLEQNGLKILLAVAFVLAIGLYFYQDENITIKTTMLQSKEKQIEPTIKYGESFAQSTGIDTIKTNSEQISQKIIKSENNDGMQNISSSEELKIEDKIITLYESTDESGRYHIKLQSNTTIDKKQNFTKYIVISGEIENENKITTFPMSLNENYINFTNDIFITIDDITKNNDKGLKCAGYFLNGLHLDNIYQMKINLSDNGANCYISSSEPMPFFLKQLKENNNKPIVIYTDDNNVSIAQ